MMRALASTLQEKVKPMKQIKLMFTSITKKRKKEEDEEETLSKKQKVNIIFTGEAQCTIEDIDDKPQEPEKGSTSDESESEPKEAVQLDKVDVIKFSNSMRDVVKVECKICR